MDRRSEALTWCVCAAIGVVILQNTLKKEAAVAGLSALELALLSSAASAFVARKAL